MTVRIEVSGTVEGEVLHWVAEGVPAVSFMLADDQHALSASGRVVPTRVAWCQVVCQSEDALGKAGSLKPGEEVVVRGSLKVVRPSTAEAQSDLVLLTLVADQVQIGLPETSRPRTIVAPI